MSCRRRCGSCASRISAVRSNSAITADRVHLLHGSQLMLRMLVLTAALAALAAPGAAQKTAGTNTKAATLKEFLARVDTYVALHKKAESTLPTLPKQTDPKQIDTHERALSKLIQAQRAGAKQGDLFTPAMQALVRTLLAPVFRGRDGAQIRAEILDNEYKGAVKLVVNGRYPDDVPISTVPPQVLSELPKLPEDLEYRFVRDNLILFDPHAHIIPDFVPHAF